MRTTDSMWRADANKIEWEKRNIDMRDDRETAPATKRAIQGNFLKWSVAREYKRACRLHARMLFIYYYYL